MMASQMYTGSDASEGESSATQLIPLLMGKRRSLASGLQWLVLIKTCKTMHEKYALNNEITQVKPLISRFSWEKNPLSTETIPISWFPSKLLLFHIDTSPYLFCQNLLLQPKIWMWTESETLTSCFRISWDLCVVWSRGLFPEWYPHITRVLQNKYWPSRGTFCGY